MLSNKMTFSLVVFLVLALGFAFVPATLAQTLGPLPVLSVIDELDEVVAKDDRKNQVTLYDWAADFAQPATVPLVDTQLEIRNLIFPDGNQNADLMLYLRLHTGRAALWRAAADGAIQNASATHPAVPAADATDAVKAAYNAVNQYLSPHDLSIMYLDKNSVVVAQVIGDAGTTIMPRNPTFPDGQNFEITIANDDIPANARYMSVSIPAGSFRHIDPRDTFRTPGAWNESSTLPDAGDPFKFKAHTADTATAAGGDTKEGDPVSEALRLFLINEDPGSPKVVSIVRTVTATSARSDASAASQFGGDPVTGSFMVKATFSEEPKLVLEDADNPMKGYKVADLPFKVVNAKITGIAKGTPFYVKPHYREGDYQAAADGAAVAESAGGVPDTTGYDRRYHPYLLTLEPDLTSSDDISIYVQGFSDLIKPAMMYLPPNNASRVNTRSMLHVPVLATAVKKEFADADAQKVFDDLAPRSNEYELPSGTVIPAEGYLVIARGDAAQSGVPAVSADKYKDETAPKRADNQTDFNFMHNVLHSQDFKVDLSDLFRTGGTIQLRYANIPRDTIADLVKKTQYKASDAVIEAGDVIISEVMWGSDLGNNGAMSQWIELHNTTKADISIDQREWVLNFSPSNALASRHTTLVDQIGNNPSSGYWQVPGSDGVSVVSTARPNILDRVSMFRIPGATDATAQASWMASPDRGNTSNFTGRALGTPGGATAYTAPTPPAKPEPTPTPPTPAAEVGDLQITEVMVSTGASGLLPQWIEISNMSGATVSLRGWSINVDNDPGDAAVAPSLNIILGDVDVGKDQAVLVVSKMSNRNSGVGTTAGMIRSDRIIDAKIGDGDAILSKMAFRIGLVPPLKAGAAGRGDVAGNLQQGWELPMAEGNARSSLIRRAMTTKGEVMGTDAAGWTLAENADGHLSAVPYETYYGDANDMGSPGLSTAGGALPVELSKFGAKRDPLTGQVIITWETQSELNNAGFFIKRSQQKNSQFVAVNPAMIPGAGTTSEKQSYTYTDTTAQPNIVYYYQIEDVSLDGNRQTLTRAHRLKGHVGAAGKLSTLWGELKEQE